VAFAKIRRYVQNLCAFASENIGPQFGGTPSTQAFGDLADEGTSEFAARVDHRHGMPDASTFVDDLEDTTMFFDELVRSTAIGTTLQTTGGLAFGGRDDVGNTGGFGTVDTTAIAGAANFTFLFAGNTAVAGSQTQTHSWKRTKRFQMRVRPVLDLASNISYRCLVGAFRTDVNGNVANTTDGVYFSVVKDALGAGNWFINATTASSSTSVDTGQAPLVNPDNTVAFQEFRIDYDLDANTATFYLDGTNVGQITTQIPPTTNKVAGYGAILRNTAATPAHTMVHDYLIIVGRRVYSE